MCGFLVALVAGCALGFETPAEKTSGDACPSLECFAPRVDDWYYPAEESAERAVLKVPRLTGIAGREVSLAMPGDVMPSRVAVGGTFHGWQVAETLERPTAMVVLERDFDRWGLILFVDQDRVVAEIRKAVGSLKQIRPPAVRFPADYFPRLLAAKEDLLGHRFLSASIDASFVDVAGCLAPCEAYTFLGSPESKRKWIVEPDGSIGLMPERRSKARKPQDVLSDPRVAIHGTASDSQQARKAAAAGKTGPQARPAVNPLRRKLGLLGSYLPAVDFGFFDVQRKAGWEVCALADCGQKPAGLVRLRRTDGPTQYYQIDPLRTLPDGKAFFAALLALQRSWERILSPGMQLEIGDRRAMDAARAGIAGALTGCVGPHPKYGMGVYWAEEHDGFPPTTLSLGTCLLDWGLLDEFKTRQGYYLDRFVQSDGTFRYYGPALAEYGQLLDLAAAYVRRTGDATWYQKHRTAIERIADRLLRLRAESCRVQSRDALTYGLLSGSAEADTASQQDYFLSGNVWCWRGLAETGAVLVQIGRRQSDNALLRRGEEMLDQARRFHADILRAVERAVVDAAGEKYLPPIVGLNKPPFQTMTQDRLASYTNYRYWPESLSAGCLPPRFDRMILDYRQAHGGELLAMTRFIKHLDDWPFYHQAYGLLAQDRVPNFLLAYYAHVAHHQTQGTFTAYEQVPIVGEGSRREQADYCVPSQLTAPILTRWMLAFEERDADVLWLCRAAPRAWFRQKLAMRGALTRWGRVDLEIRPTGDLQRYSVKIAIPAESRPAVNLRIRHPQQWRIAECRVIGGRCERIEADRELVVLRPSAKTLTAEILFQR